MNGPRTGARGHGHTQSHRAAGRSDLLAELTGQHLHRHATQLLAELVQAGPAGRPAARLATALPPLAGLLPSTRRARAARLVSAAPSRPRTAPGRVNVASAGSTATQPERRPPRRSPVSRRPPPGPHSPASARRPLVKPVGQPVVAQHRPVAHGVPEEVSWLDIPVLDAAAMQVGQPLGDVVQVADCISRWKRHRSPRTPPWT